MLVSLPGHSPAGVAGRQGWVTQPTSKPVVSQAATPRQTRSAIAGCAHQPSPVWVCAERARQAPLGIVNYLIS